MRNSNSSVLPPHWRYKEGSEGSPLTNKKSLGCTNTQGVKTWPEAARRPRCRRAKTELFNDTIYVLTPHGKVLPPTGLRPSTAYALRQATVAAAQSREGQICLSAPLENGQRVEIVPPKGNPSVSWLYEGWVKSTAIAKIRATIRQQNIPCAKKMTVGQTVCPPHCLQAASLQAERLLPAASRAEISNALSAKACGA